MNYQWRKHENSITLVEDSIAFAKQLQSYFLYINRHSSFYRQRVEQTNIALEDAMDLLAAFPVSTKADYKDYLQQEALVALGNQFFISDYSSGSTDACVLRFSSVREELAEQSITETVFQRAGLRSGDRFVCLEVGAPEIYDFYCRAARNIGASQTAYLKVTHNYARSFAPLQRLQPQVVLSLPSLMIKAWPTIKHFWPHGQSPVRSFIHMGEPMHPELKQEIETVWGCNVYSFYGTTELGGMGGECAWQHGCHFDPTLICPTLMNPKEVGENVFEGEGFFTTLHFQHQTVVKYRVGDLVQIDLSPCPCGEKTPRLTFIERTNDSFIITGDKFRYDVILNALKEKIDGLDLMTIRLNDAPGSEKSIITLLLPEPLKAKQELILDVLKYDIFELDSVYHYGFVDFALEFIPSAAFGERKSKRVIDERKYFS